ncbi:MAG: hypothetical protein ACJA0P_004367 [Planctomycetota bacterium]|jgi:hypothetical protein
MERGAWTAWGMAGAKRARVVRIMGVERDWQAAEATGKR